jgi:hypothetical protein
MHEEQDDMKQLVSGWRIVLLIWGAILASLGVYLIVCLNIGTALQVNIAPDFPLTTLKYALFGVACVTLVVVFILRKFLLNPDRSGLNSTHTTSAQHPAITKYTQAVVITSALLESIGIYGVVLFLLAKDTRSLYQLLIISAAAMVYFRPRKEELLKLAKQMKEHCQNLK